MQYQIKPGAYYNNGNKDWYAQRNQEILKDKQAGMSNKDLVKKYDISPVRIQYIVKHEREKHEFKR